MGKQNQRFPIETVRNDFREKGYTLVSTEYKNINSKLEYICDKHKDYGVQEVSYASLRQNKHNCKLCRNVFSKENWHKSRKFKPISQVEFFNKHFEKYKAKLYEAVGDEYTLIDIYSKNNGCILKLIHNVCGNIYEVEQRKFFKSNFRCQNKECRSERKRRNKLKTTESFKQELFDLVGDEYELVDRYLGTNITTTFLHTKCRLEFDKTPHNFLAGQRCPYCTTPISAPTKGEQKIIDFLESHLEKYTFQKMYPDLKGMGDGRLSYDFFLEERNLLIEYQGQFHDGSAFQSNVEGLLIQQEHDKRKKAYAKDHNINFLEIWYWDFDNIENILEKTLYGENVLAS